MNAPLHVPLLRHTIGEITGSLFDLFRLVFDARTGDQRDTLAVTCFHNSSDVFEQVRAQIPPEWTQAGATDYAQQRTMMFFALAAARMRIAEQLQVALHDGMQSATRSRPSQAYLMCLITGIPEA